MWIKAKLSILIILILASPFLLGTQVNHNMRVMLQYNINPFIPQQPVEQQTLGGATQPDKNLWVFNRTRAIWDADDDYKFWASGRLNPGQSFSVNRDVITDWNSHFVGIYASGNLRSDFTATISFSEGHSVNTINRIEGRLLVGKAGMLTPDYMNKSTKLEPIADSNGGVGQRITVTWTITNSGNKTADFILQGEINLQTDSVVEVYCPGKFPLSMYGQHDGFDPMVYWVN